ncbi:hypothetical protein RIF23_05390 [Lipingzhangella sp. LS1_29]|uniref:Glycosyltransferase RgtA/B/C/D-like domain-containing protein n=1 Tax=Lipingzhangella rawalii TaxID=2055835 RepID=A0ABU2H4D9_9ACTN|nr:hypothetical protein [Lipingzhangella rawalii]MDS1269724.1 hypothetical protein [Lipingzhangella rawalii]
MSAGRLLARGTALPVLVVGAWLLVSFPLLLFGQLTPVVGVAVGAPVVVVVATLVPRFVPDLPEHTPWWAVLGVGAVTVAFAAVQMAYHGEEIVVRRDAASYAQFTHWIAEHGSLPIPQQRELIAGDDPALSYQSLAFYQVGEVIWPQFLAGTPLTLTVGHWLGGIPGMLLTTPVLGALGVLVMAGLTARLVGPRWAPLAALLLALSLPHQWASRATYSEPVAQLLMLGALVLAVDALRTDSGVSSRRTPPTRVCALVLGSASGLAFGLGTVVRIDALRDLLPVVLFLGLLLLVRRAPALAMSGGLLVGLGYGGLASYVLSRPYVEYLADSVVPMLWVAAGVLAGTVAITAARWRRGLPGSIRPTWVATAAAAVPVLVVLGLALRPLVWQGRGHGHETTDAYVAYVQELEGLAVDGARTYTEMSLYWVGWYLGLATVLFATLGAALLLRRILRGEAPDWALPLLVLGWSVALTLARPAITPDHPWASRRLLVLVLPAFVLLAVWALARGVRALREQPERVPRPLLPLAVTLGVVVLVLPTAVTAHGIMTYRSDVGSVEQAERLCAQLPERASVLTVDDETGNSYLQLFRGMCGVPAARVTTTEAGTIHRLAAEVRSRDRVPVLAASSSRTIARYDTAGDYPTRAFRLNAEQDPSTLMRPPAGSWDVSTRVFLLPLTQGYAD